LTGFSFPSALSFGASAACSPPEEVEVSWVVELCGMAAAGFLAVRLAAERLLLHPKRAKKKPKSMGKSSFMVSSLLISRYQ
jgi:hypothetical protein